ncbi:MAG: retroviral-like aspartic protease family protein [Bacteroidia bacterium]
MAKIYPFVRETDDDLIVITARIGNSIVDLVLDTGASHTFINFGVLIKEGYRVGDTKGLIPVETANGIIYANRFDISHISALGITKDDFEVTSYLFDDPEGNYQGVIGLDFLAGTKFCVDMDKSEITIKVRANK